uniref:Cystatin domain-containing protein n=1 Tax=Kalanchoe fedtschenkoi TaxID=63787 RepID=A0A7N1A9I3_KALFE
MDFEKSTLLLIFLLACTARIVSSNQDDQAEAPYLGVFISEWFPLKDICDPKIQAIAKFAVEEQGRRIGDDGQFTLVNVISGEEQIVSGINYRLILMAALKNSYPRMYQTIVYKNHNQKRELILFERISDYVRT